MSNTSDCLSTILNIFIAVGTVAVAVLAIWGDAIRSKLASPRLSLHLLNSHGEIIWLADGQRAIYYHFRVVNSRPWSVAKNCRVILKAFYRRSADNTFYPKVYAVVPQLRWTPSEFSPSAIELSTEHVLDFGRLEEHGTRFQPRLYFYPNNFDVDVEVNGIGRYELEILADGYRARHTYMFEVAWDGQWTDHLDEMPHHLVIKEVASRG